MPIVPVVLNALVIAGLGGVTTTSDSVEEPVPPAFVALMVAANVPLALGVPEISPVDALTPNPGGRPIAPKLVGLLLAVIW